MASALARPPGSAIRRTPYGDLETKLREGGIVSPSLDCERTESSPMDGDARETRSNRRAGGPV